MGEKPVFDEYYSLWLLLAQTRSAIFKARHKKVGQYLPPNQAAALISIWDRNGRMTPALLARGLFLEPHSVSELIDRMQLNGLVAKEKDRRRGNVVRIKITQKGIDVCKKVMGQGLIHTYMTKLSAGQRKTLRESLEILYANAQNDLGIRKEDAVAIGDKG
jgi:DNA-binding MarR family transcriptional regulator